MEKALALLQEQVKSQALFIAELEPKITYSKR